MNCEQFKESLLDFLYDEVSEAARAEMTHHLQACAPCNAEVNEFKLVRNELAEWKYPVTHHFPITLPYPTPLRMLKDRLFPERWTWRNATALAMVAGVLVLVTFSILGTQIEVSKNGFVFRVDLFRRFNSAPSIPSLDTVAPGKNLLQSVTLGRGGTERTEILREVSQRIQESENRQQQLLKSEEMRIVNQLTSGYRTQLADLAKTLDNKHKLDLVQVYDNLEQQRLADLQKIRLTFSSLDERTSYQARQTQQLVDLIQKASYQPK